MTEDQKTCARKCLDAAEANSMTFPEIVGTLHAAGFEAYAVDFRASTARYYLDSGDVLNLETPSDDVAVEAVFDFEALRAAILEAQILAPGYSYTGFRRKAKIAGCAGYMVSFIGRRAVYFGRTAETHVEVFPQHAK